MYVDIWYEYRKTTMLHTVEENRSGRLLFPLIRYLMYVDVITWENPWKNTDEVEVEMVNICYEVTRNQA